MGKEIVWSPTSLRQLESANVKINGTEIVYLQQ